MTSDSIVLQRPGGASTAIAIAEVVGVEGFVRSRRHPFLGGLVGLGVGLGTLATRDLFEAGCVVSVNDECIHETSPFLLPDVDGFVILGGGVVLGALVGSVVRTEEWRALPWPPSDSSAVPIVEVSARRIRLGVRVRAGAVRAPSGG